MSLLSSSGGLAVLRNRNLAFYLSARFLGTLAVQMQSVAIGWQVYQITGSLFDLGLIGLAQFAPFLVLILWAGHVADRYNRRNIVLLCMATQLLCSLLLVGFTASSSTIVWPVFAILVLFGSARAFMMPASQAVLKNLVPDQDFSQAVALSSSTFHVAVIAGPIIGGLLYAFGPMTVHMVAASLLTIAVLCMSRTRATRQARSQGPVSWHSLMEGLRFVWSRPSVLGAISLDLFAVLFGGATALLPAYAHDVLQVGPTGLGLLRTAPGLGAALCSIALAFFPITRRVGLWMFGGVAVFGLSTLVMGFTSSFPVALGALFLLGAGDMVSAVLRSSMLQLAAPEGMRGRMQGVFLVVVAGGPRLGDLRAGAIASAAGVTVAMVSGGVVVVVAMVVVALAVPSFWFFRASREAQPSARD